jgi:hypothetical protein
MVAIAFAFASFPAYLFLRFAFLFLRLSASLLLRFSFFVFQLFFVSLLFC